MKDARYLWILRFHIADTVVHDIVAMEVGIVMRMKSHQGI